MDTYKFFHDPVTDEIAPGYSSVITTPMCFLTMKEKHKKEEYTNLDQIWDDFKLICDNCMKFNKSDTIYHLEAERMLIDGMKAANRAREKVGAQFYDPNKFYDPYGDTMENSIEDEQVGKRDRRVEIQSEFNLTPLHRKLMDWIGIQKNTGGSGGEEVIEIPYHSQLEIESLANAKRKLSSEQRAAIFSKKVDNADLVAIGEGTPLSVPFAINTHSLATPENYIESLCRFLHPMPKNFSHLFDKHLSLLQKSVDPQVEQEVASVPTNQLDMTSVYGISQAQYLSILTINNLSDVNLHNILKSRNV
eukprot:TRINITY_DN461_c0_g1_i16.p1 TRINITY_DN461_c0_g1~~TRINITY_DN461_c0_g1_i16.p1  ORF type:complete len:305 (-),score=67.37 TRINITY_DN461_c0_g1_i16:84-998(-)